MKVWTYLKAAGTFLASLVLSPKSLLCLGSFVSAPRSWCLVPTGLPLHLSSCAHGSQLRVCLESERLRTWIFQQCYDCPHFGNSYSGLNSFFRMRLWGAQGGMLRFRFKTPLKVTFGRGTRSEEVYDLEGRVLVPSSSLLSLSLVFHGLSSFLPPCLPLCRWCLRPASHTWTETIEPVAQLNLSSFKL